MRMSNDKREEVVVKISGDHNSTNDDENDDKNEKEALDSLMKGLALKRSLRNTGTHDEWLNLYQFQRTFRLDHNITASDILDYLKLPLSMLQYMYSLKSIPNKKSGTLGEKLRSGIAELKKEGKQLLASGNLAYKVKEYYENNKTNLLKNDGIDLLYVSDDGYLVFGSTMRPLRCDAVTDIVRDLDVNDLPTRIETYRDLTMF